MISSEELGRRVRKAREEAKLSQGQLGELLQPPRSHAAISDIERGVTRAGASDIFQIAQILGKTDSYFSGQENATSRTAMYGRGSPTKELEEQFKRDAEEYLKRGREKQ